MVIIFAIQDVEDIEKFTLVVSRRIDLSVSNNAMSRLDGSYWHLSRMEDSNVGTLGGQR